MKRENNEYSSEAKIQSFNHLYAENNFHPAWNSFCFVIVWQKFGICGKSQISCKILYLSDFFCQIISPRIFNRFLSQFFFFLDLRNKVQTSFRFVDKLFDIFLPNLNILKKNSGKTYSMVKVL